MPSTIGPYRLLRLLGEGGMGAVYEGIHESIERRVAIKILKPECTCEPDAVARFRREARAVNRIEHLSLVQVSDSGHTDDDALYLVMEFLRGETLQERLRRMRRDSNRLSIDVALNIAWQVADALSAAHEKGVVHRDIKPANLMLVSDAATAIGERVKILDFGIAKLLKTSDVLTVQPQSMGTPSYMAPEQIRADFEIDGRADVYSLGIMLYEMLAARPPFEGAKLESLLGQHLFAEAPPLRSLAPQAPQSVANLVHKMLAKQPAERPTMSEVGSRLAALLGAAHGQVNAATVLVPGLAAQISARPRQPCTGLLALALAILGVGIALTNRPGPIAASMTVDSDAVMAPRERVRVRVIPRAWQPSSATAAEPRRMPNRHVTTPVLKPAAPEPQPRKLNPYDF